jgi:hypothetical protein
MSTLAVSFVTSTGSSGSSMDCPQAREYEADGDGRNKSAFRSL